MKTLALDHLGVIAAHLRTSTLKFKRDSNETGLAPLDEVNNLRRRHNKYILMLP